MRVRGIWMDSIPTVWIIDCAFLIPIPDSDRCQVTICLPNGTHKYSIVSRDLGQQFITDLSVEGYSKLTFHYDPMDCEDEEDQEVDG